MQIVFIYKYFWVIGVKKASNLRPPSSASVRTTSADNVRTRISTTCRWQTLSSFRAGCGDRFAHDETVRDEFRAIAVRGAWRAKSKFV